MATVGQVVAGRYRIVRPLAAGGLGHVWLAIDTARGDQVAIKQCALPDELTDAERDLVRQWTEREARALANVDHPNVVRTLAVLPDAGQPWLVMEYVPSRSLQQILEASGPLPPARVAQIGVALLAGLTAAGRAGVLHLDVKPGNVLVADDGRVVLADFGPAVTRDGVRALAEAGIILGSPRYVAPERLFDGVTTAQADLWSVGATLYHAVEGRPPFLRATTEAALLAADDGRPDPPRQAGPLTPVLEGLLRRDPTARLSAEEATARLRRIADAAPPRPVAATRRVIRRRAAVLAAICLTAASTAAAIGSSRSGGQQHAVRPTHTAMVLPAGYAWWTDPTGFQVGVPGSWRCQRDATGTALCSNAKGRPSLRISTWSQSPTEVVPALVAQERQVDLPAYRRLQIYPVSRRPAVAVWEFTYQDDKGATMRSLRQVFEGDDRTYVIEWRAENRRWSAELPKLSVALGSFTTTRI